MPERLVAKHTRPDGELAVRVEVPHYFDREEAARALAVVYPDQVPIRGEREVRTGLGRAARERVLSRPASMPDEALVAAYRPIVDRHWPKFAKYAADDVWVGVGHERAVKARFDVASFFSREEAAVALALVYERVPARTGRMTVEHGLQRAAAQRVLAREDAERVAGVELVQEWRGWLGVMGPWVPVE